MRLHFGKYQGWEIQDVPEEYLQWLLQSSRQTIDMCETELRRREAVELASMDWIDRIIKSGYRDLAKRHHPDVGGNEDDMKRLNAAFEALKQARGGSV